MKRLGLTLVLSLIHIFPIDSVRKHVVARKSNFVFAHETMRNAVRDSGADDHSSVSYTHLDVYKRQLFTYANIRICFIA